MQIIRHADLSVSRWNNGAGRKADFAGGDGWSVGFAWLDANAPFSDYTGHDRTIMLVEGPGFTLDVPDAPALTVTVPFVPMAFDGGWPTFCRIVGPSRVLNVVTRRARLTHDFVAVGGSGWVPSSLALAQYLVVLRGTVQLSGATLGAWDGVSFDQPLTPGSPDGGMLARIAIRGLSPG